MFQHGFHPTIHLKTSLSELANFAHRKHDIIGPIGRAVGQSVFPIPITDLPFIEMPFANAQEQVVDLIEVC